MNKIYKVVLNRCLGVFVVASELAKSHGKGAAAVCGGGLVGGLRRRFAVKALVAALMAGGLLSEPVFAETGVSDSSTPSTSTTANLSTAKQITFTNVAEVEVSNNDNTGSTISTVSAILSAKRAEDGALQLLWGDASNPNELQPLLTSVTFNGDMGSGATTDASGSLNVKGGTTANGTGSNGKNIVVDARNNELDIALASNLTGITSITGTGSTTMTGIKSITGVSSISGVSAALTGIQSIDGVQSIKYASGTTSAALTMNTNGALNWSGTSFTTPYAVFGSGSVVPNITYMDGALSNGGSGSGEFNALAGLTPNKMKTVVDANGLHLLYSNGQNATTATEKATVTLLNPADKLPSNITEILTKTGDNGAATAIGTIKSNGDVSGNAFQDTKNLGLLVGTLAGGSATGVKTQSGKAYMLSVGFDNYIVPGQTPQTTIFNTTLQSFPDANGISYGANVVTIGYANSVMGNGGMAIGTLNRVYGNGGLVIANTPIASSYSSAGRFGTTIGYNVKAGEWGSKNMVVGTNLQVVGNNNVVMGGGDDKYFGGTNGGWGDSSDSTTIGNVFSLINSVGSTTLSTLPKSAMRFWGDNNIVLGAKNRTEGFNPVIPTIDGENGKTSSSGYSGNPNETADTKSYNRITDNAVVGANNSLYDLSFSNSIYGANNLVASGRNNMVIGSSNILEAQIMSTSNSVSISAILSGEANKTTGVITPTSPGKGDELGVADLYNVSKNVTRNSSSLKYAEQNAVIGAFNRVGYNTMGNLLAGSQNTVRANSSNNMLAGSGNYVNVSLNSASMSALISKKNDLRAAQSRLSELQTSLSAASGTVRNSLSAAIVAQNSTISATQSQINSLITAAKNSSGSGTTDNNMLFGSDIVVGTKTKNNILLGSGINVQDEITGAYVLGSNVDVKSNNSVYFGDSSVATLTAVDTAGAFVSDSQSINSMAQDARNKYLTAGELGQQFITINGKTYTFAGQGTSGGGVITVGGITQKPDGSYSSAGRIIQNVAPGLIGANSTDAINGSQLFSVFDAVNATVNQIISGEVGPVVYTTNTGEKLLKENNVFYTESLVAANPAEPGSGYRQAVNGLWYLNSEFDANGALRSGVTDAEGRTLQQLLQAKIAKDNGYTESTTTDSGKVVIKWYKDSDGASNAKSFETLLTTDASLSTAFSGNNVTYDSKKVVLSLVNADQQTSGNSLLQSNATKAYTELANLKSALKDPTGVEDIAQVNQENVLSAALSTYNSTHSTTKTLDEFKALLTSTDDAQSADRTSAIKTVNTTTSTLLANRDAEIVNTLSNLSTATVQSVAQSTVSDLLGKGLYAEGKNVSALKTELRDLSRAATLRDLQTVARAGLTFQGDEGDAVHRQLSETLYVKGSNGISVSGDGVSTLTISLDKTDAITTSTSASESESNSTTITNNLVTETAVRNYVSTQISPLQTSITNNSNAISELQSNTIKLTGNGSSSTDEQELGKSGGLSFAIEGDGSYLTTDASGSKVTVKPTASVMSTLSTVAVNTTNIAANTANITTNTSNISTLTTNVSNNATNITNLSSKIDTLNDKTIELAGNEGTTGAVKLATSPKFTIKGDGSVLKTSVSGNTVTLSLTTDTTPTANSVNPITSGGVYTAISNLSTVYATTDLSNLTSTGKSVIAGLIDVASGDANTLGVTASTDATSGKKTFTLKPLTGAVSASASSLVTGGTAFDAISGARTEVASADNLLKVEGGSESGIAAKKYTVSVNVPALTSTLASTFVEQTRTIALNGDSTTGTAQALSSNISFKVAGDGSAISTAASGSTVTVSLKDGGVTESKIANGAVTTNKIANNAVTINQVDSSISTSLGKADTALQSFDVGADVSASASAIAVNQTNKRVDIVGDKGVTTAVDGRTIKVGITQSELSVVSGSVSAITSGDSYATATNVANAINTAISSTTQQYAGDTADVTIKRKPTDVLTVKGGADVTKLSDNNIGVVADANSGSLTVKLAKELSGLTSATFVSDSLSTVVNGGGIVINDGTNTTKFTNDGISAGGQQITNVGSGLGSLSTVNSTNSSNVANLGDVNTLVNAAAWTISGKDASLSAVSGSVNSGDVVDFQNGTYSKATVVKTSTSANETFAVKWDVNTASLSVADSGNVSVTNGDNAFATASNVASTINTAISNTAQQYAGDVAASDSLSNLITRKPSEKLTIKGGVSDVTKLSDGNIGVVSNPTDGSLTVKLAKELSGLTSATFVSGSLSTVVNGGGIVINDGTNTTKFTNNGISAGGQQITNVGSGLGDATSVTDGNKTNVANLGDVSKLVGNAAWKVKKTTGATPATTDIGDVNSGDTVNFKDGAGTTVVVGKDDADSSETFNVSFDVKTATLSLSTSASGNTWVTDNTGNAFATAKTVADALNSISNSLSSVSTNLSDAKFGLADDEGNTVLKPLSTTVAVVGAKDADNHQNITTAVDASTSALTVKLSDTLKLADSGSLTIGSTIVSNNGVSVGGVNIQGGTSVNGNNVSTAYINLGDANTKVVLKNIAAPTDNNDAANKEYVDDQVKGAAWTISGLDSSTSTVNGSVNSGDVVDFQNGTYSKATISAGTVNGKDTFTVKWDVNTASLSVADSGNVSVTDGNNAFATASNVANAINTAISSTTQQYAGDNSTVTVKRTPSQVLKITGGASLSALTDNNIGTVGNADGSIAVKLAKDIDLGNTGSLKTGSTTINNAGVTAASVTGTTVTVGGSTNGIKLSKVTGSSISGATSVPPALQIGTSGDPVQLKNIANGVLDNDAVNMAQLNATNSSINTVSASLSSATFGLAGNEGTATNKLNTTISVIGEGGVTTTASGDGTAANPAKLTIKLNPQVTLGDTANAGSLTVQDKGTAGSTKAVKIAGGAVTFTDNAQPDNSYANYALNVVKGDKLLGSDATNSPRLSFNGNQLATLDDGMGYLGDLGSDTGVANHFNLKLNKQLTVTGGYPTGGSLSGLTNGNIGVVSNGTDTLSLRLAKDITQMNSIAFGDSGENNTNPYIKMSLNAPTSTSNSPVLNLASKTGLGLPRITGVFTELTGSGRVFHIKGDDDVVTVGDLKSYTQASGVIDARIDNLWYGFRTTKDGTTTYAVRHPVSSDTGAANTIDVRSDGNVVVKATGTGANNENGDLTIALNKDLKLGDNESRSGGSLTIDGDDNNERIKLDGSSSQISITDGNNQRLLLDGTTGEISFTNNDNPSTTTTIGLTDTKVADLSGTETYRIKMGDVAAATMNDGLKFAGNSEASDKIVKRKLNETLQIKGGVTIGSGETVDGKTTDKNTYVDADPTSGSLTVRLAKDLTDLNSAKFISGSISTVVNGGGITISQGADSSKTVSLTQNGLNNGGNKITNLADGVADTDAVTMKQLKDAKADAQTAANKARTQVTGSGAAVVTKTTGRDGGPDTYNVHVDEVMAYTDADGNKLVKGADGKWHKASDLANKAYVGNKWYEVDANGALKEMANAPAEVTPASLKLVNQDGTTTTATQLGNLASAIGGETSGSNGNTFLQNLNKVGGTGTGAVNPNMAVTTQDLKNLADSGFKLTTSGSGTSASTVKLGDTVKVADGANTKVSAVTDADGTHSFQVNVSGLPMAFKDAEGNPLVKIGNDFYKASDIGADGKLKNGATTATPAGVTLVDKDGKASEQKLGGIKSSIDDVNVQGNPSASFTDKLNQAAADNKLKNAAVNVGDLKQVADAAKHAQDTAEQGFTVKIGQNGGNTGGSKATTGQAVKPGDTFTFVAGNNITLTQDDGKLTISASNQGIVNGAQLPITYTTTDSSGNQVKVYKGDDGKFYTVPGVDSSGKLDDGSSAADKEVAANNIGTSLQDASGSVTNPTKLHNVADGTVAAGSKEAINGGQLYQYLGIKEGDKVTFKEITVEGGKTVMVPVDEKGQPYLKTYNVTDRGEFLTNNVYTAIHNMNEQGTKFFHVNAGQDVPDNQRTNTEDSSAAAKYSMAVGYQASVESGATNAIALGSGATVKTGSENAIALGYGGMVNGKNSISIGTGNQVVGNGSGAFGDPSFVNGDNSYAFGNNNRIGNASASGGTTTTNGAFIMGNNAVIAEGADNAVAIGSNTKVTQANSVALGAGAQATQTLEQLQSAVPAGDPRVVQGYGKAVVGEVSVGSVDEDTGEQQVRRITNVAAGSAPTDAVNVSQLQGQLQNIRGDVDNRINGLSRDIDGVAANAAAMANLPQPSEPGKSMVSVGTGAHRSQQAFAIGVSRISDNGMFIFKASASHNTRGSTTVGAGLGIQW